MPGPQKAVVRVLLADGSEVLAPVFDVKHSSATTSCSRSPPQMPVTVR